MPFSRCSLVVYLLTLGSAAHLYSWVSYAGVNMISYLLSFMGHGPPSCVGAEKYTNIPMLSWLGHMPILRKTMNPQDKCYIWASFSLESVTKIGVLRCGHFC